jgi:[ribosomal protein S18]-alanine N-acetyltransferase
MPEAATANSRNSVMIERMTEHDLLEVVEIEELSNLSPWGWDAYHLELQCGSASLMLVARLRADEKSAHKSIVGFIVAREMADEIHVNNVAVRPEYRRLRIGEMLLRAVLAWGADKNSAQAVLEVRAGNAAAQNLYQACGFEVIGRRRRYYKAPVEDALLMAVSLKRKP